MTSTILSADDDATKLSLFVAFDDDIDRRQSAAISVRYTCRLSNKASVLLAAELKLLVIHIAPQAMRLLLMISCIRNRKSNVFMFDVVNLDIQIHV